MDCFYQVRHPEEGVEGFSLESGVPNDPCLALIVFSSTRSWGQMGQGSKTSLLRVGGGLGGDQFYQKVLEGQALRVCCVRGAELELGTCISQTASGKGSG